ncbi:MAG: iojap-like ribosome-associated protein [Solidesulfovibrio magneticus str. Maddingley MBC34]|uniref:Ribosomal silencing factor RsfS n=1 Tax=Solidesulfovibrio magneticus str. Maddingley MBC34 TaxID=1206767 RepID=K6HBD1_9BACT|nr:MAG: iojap-like ribosome-associated protein [Solidesulfovibrio magneticus str. Maddingley MBC34]
MSVKSADANIAPAAKAAQVAAWLYEKKAKEIQAVDVTGLSPICEAMVMASAGSARQAQALADHVLARCGEFGYSYLGQEGYRLGQWVLLDLNDVLVNIFMGDQRSFYNLEGLWSEGKPIALRLAPAAKTPAPGAADAADPADTGDEDDDPESDA